MSVVLGRLKDGVTLPCGDGDLLSFWVSGALDLYQKLEIPPILTDGKLAQEGRRIILHFQTPTDEFEIETKFLKSIFFN